MQPTVSVILPYYNAENTLGMAVRSILNQSFNNFELLLINNNSSDKSLEIAESLAKTDSRIYLLNEIKPGVANAMNCGLKNARGKYLARMDADDIALRERLEQQISFLTKNPEIGLVGSNVTYIAHSKNTRGFQRFVDWANSFHSTAEIESNRFIEIPVINPTILFRRELFEKLGGCLDGDFPEDYEMQLRYLEAGVKMAKLPQALLEWHDYSTRLTRNDGRYSSDSFLKVKAVYFKNWSEKYNPFHPNIHVWGAGRKTRQRVTHLKRQGLQVQGFIDIIKSKSGSLYYQDIPKAGKIFIVSMVANTGAGPKIREFLLKRNYKEKRDFIMMG